MADHVSIEGAEKLAAIGKRLKEIGDKELKKQLAAGLRKAAAPMVQAVQGSAESTLPHTGGLAALIGDAKVTVSNRLSGNNVGVRITAKLPGVDLGSLDRGRLRHPVFKR